VTVLLVCGRLQTAFSGSMLANNDIVTLRTASRLLFLLASLLALHLNGCLHVSLIHRARVTVLASAQASKS